MKFWVECHSELLRMLHAVDSYQVCDRTSQFPFETRAPVQSILQASLLLLQLFASV